MLFFCSPKYKIVTLYPEFRFVIEQGECQNTDSLIVLEFTQNLINLYNIYFMRKIYSFFATAAMFVASLTASAYDFTLPSENAVLQNETYHMRLFKTWDFIGLTVNDNAITPETFTTGASDNTGMPVCDGYTPAKVTNEGMEGWYMGIGDIQFHATNGLYNAKNGIRYVILSGLKEGQILCIQDGAASEFVQEVNDVKIHNYVVNCNRIQKASLDGEVPAWTASTLSHNNSYDVVEEITDDVHAIQNEGVDLEAEGAESLADSYRYFKVIADGPLYIAMGKYASIQGVQIWIDANAQESVSAPEYKIVGVNGNTRNIELTTGESTFGSACQTMYGILDAGGTYEDYEYNKSDGYFTISASDDEDGDGIVTIQTATVSETGGVSEIKEFQIDINPIQLNAPTLSLSGLDGTKRIYSIGWSNNTLCGESFSFLTEGDDASYYDDALTVGSTFSVEKNAKVIVKADGYVDAEVSIDVDYPGVVFQSTATEGSHNWDFSHPSQDVVDLLTGNKVSGCYIENAETGDKTYYTLDEYNEGVAADGTDLSSAVKVIEESGWSWDGSNGRMRASLLVEATTTTDEEGNETTTYAYKEDKANLLGEGLTVTCGPSSAGVGQIMNYLGNFNLGLTFMSAPTFTFDRSILKAGQVVIFTIGAGGGSNYLTYADADNTIPVTQEVVFVCPTDQLLTATLPRPSSNFCHVLNIDIYTQDNLPVDEYDPNAEETAIKSVEAAGAASYFSVSGAKLSAPQKGINIVKYSNGTTKKVLVK